MEKRIYLSPPHMGDNEFKLVKDAFDSNWIAPLGPHVDAFEEEFARKVGSKYAVALNSGTAALHLALRYAGVGPGDEVFCSTLTFIASATPILFLGARPVFIDSDEISWNMDPGLLAEALRRKAEKNCLPKAVVVVHLYGQSADMESILDICREYEAIVVEDAAEALGATYMGRSPGTFGQSGIFSFNGNKIITTSGGGMLVTNDERLADKTRFWASQAKEPVAHYEHVELGYNYRMSNILAAIGRGQLGVLDERVRVKRQLFERYTQAFQDLPGLQFMPEPEDYVSTRWITCILIDQEQFGATADMVCKHLSNGNIEARPLWKPMHMQPLFAENEMFGGRVAENFFNKGLCLPSGTAMSDQDFSRVVDAVRTCCKR